MLHTNWLRTLPWRALGRGRRAAVQVGFFRSPTDLVAARVHQDFAGGYRVEQLEAADIRTQPEEAALARLLQSGVLRDAPVVVVLSAEHYGTYPLPAPSVPQAELREALRWKLREVLPYAPEDAVIDCVWMARAEDSSTAQNLLTVAAPRRTVAQATAPLLNAGCQVHAVDIAEMAQRNLLARLPGDDTGRALLGLDESSALLTVVDRGALCFARRIQIPRSLGAEDDDPEHVAARIATQVQHSLEVVERQSGLAPVRTVWVGPHAYCALIARCTAEHTGLECLQLDLQAELRFASNAPELPPERAGGALIAIGAALRSEQAAATRSAVQNPAVSWLSKLKAA